MSEGYEGFFVLGLMIAAYETYQILSTGQGNEKTENDLEEKEPESGVLKPPTYFNFPVGYGDFLAYATDQMFSTPYYASQAKYYQDKAFLLQLSKTWAGNDAKKQLVTQYLEKNPYHASGYLYNFEQENQECVKKEQRELVKGPEAGEWYCP